MATEPQMLSNSYFKHECNSNIQNATNQRIYDRNIPSQFLQPYLSVRPVLTKYSIMPIVDPRAPAKVPMQQVLKRISSLSHLGARFPPRRNISSNR